MLEKLVRPGNIEAINPPRVNEEIWKVAQHRTRDVDMKLKWVQNLLNKGLIPQLQLLEHLKKKKDREEERGTSKIL